MNLKLSIRNLNKNKTSTVINIVGLTLGFTGFILIALFLNHETSYDKFHANYENIYRINSDYHSSSGDIFHLVNTPPAVAPGIRGKFPEIEKVSRLRYTNRILLSKDDRFFYEDQGFYADSAFFDIFSFNLKEGNRITALDAPNSIVLTEAMARKYFGDSDPLGQSIRMNDNRTLNVTGILEPVPSNSHIQFNYLISFPTYEVPPGVPSNLSDWGWLGFLTYIKMVEGADPVVFQNKLNELYVENTPDWRLPHEAHIQLLENIYLGSASLTDDLASPLKTGSKTTLYALAAIAILILLVAGFNYMNLTTASQVSRIRETGIQKALGINKGTLILQLLTETIILALISFVLAGILSVAIFPHLQKLVSWDFAIQWNKILKFLPFVILLVIAIGMLTGLYPALLLSGKKTVTALQTKSTSNSTKPTLRNALIAIQFCITIGLIISTMVVTRQINFMREQNLGFNRENILTVKLLPEDMNRYYSRLKEALLHNSNVIDISNSGRRMGSPWPVNQISVDGEEENMQITNNWVGYDFIKTMGINLKEGRSFSNEYANDSTQSIILNESAVKHLGLKNPIGTKVWFWGLRTVIGVVEDFNFSSLHHEISPVALTLPITGMENMYVKVASGKLDERIALIEDTWKQVGSGAPLEINFLDEQLDRLYSKEVKLSYLVKGFSILAIALACLGLYGLVAFMVKMRTKEIGVRKVLGATATSALTMLTKNFVYLVLGGFMLATPIAYFAMNKWLESFAYKTELSWWIFALAGLLALGIALLTVSWQSWRAATRNPVEALRYE